MAGQSFPMTSNYEASILNKEVKSSSLMSLQCKLSDEEPLVQQHPPRPTILKSLNKDPDPDLQLTPLKQKEQPKSLLRSNSSSAKVRHRVRFQESFSSESEQEISNKISEISIDDTSLNYEIEHENQNNNSLRSESTHDVNISAPNALNCLFLDTDSGLFEPQLMSIEVIREVDHNKTPLTSTSDVCENNAKTRPKSSAGFIFSDTDKSIALSKVQSIHFENSAIKENCVKQIKKTSKDIVNMSGQPCELGATSSKPHLASSLLSSAAPAANSTDKRDDIFTQPKIHSSIILAQRIKTLQKKQPDLTCELKKNLENSEARNKINEKAATKVDIGIKQDLYTGLISLDVTDLELEEAAIVHKATKVKNTKKQHLTSGLEPDLLEFFTEDLQKETADFSLPGMPNYSITNFQAPSLIAFDLYRHNGMWEELPATL